MQIIIRMVMMRIIMRTMNFSYSGMTFEKRPDLKLSQGEGENQFGADFFKCLKEEKSSKLKEKEPIWSKFAVESKSLFEVF